MAANAPLPGHHRPRARAVISLFQHGGPSQMDLFDEKPTLNTHSGKPYPGGDLEVHFDKQAGNVLGAPYRFRNSPSRVRERSRKRHFHCAGCGRNHARESEFAFE